MTDARTFGLTTRATELLAVIRESMVRTGSAPTYRQMAAACEISISGVHRLITQLVNRGLVECMPGRQQSIRLIEPHTIALPEDVALTLRHAARFYGRTPDEHAAAVIRQHCQISPSPF